MKLSRSLEKLQPADYHYFLPLFNHHLLFLEAVFKQIICLVNLSNDFFSHMYDITYNLIQKAHTEQLKTSVCDKHIDYIHSKQFSIWF